MVIGSEQLRPFHFVESWHPFYTQIQSFQRALDESPLCRRIQVQESAPGKTAVHSEIKGRLLPDGQWELNRFYWSFQYWDPSLAHGFHAVTLYYSVKERKTSFYQFPEDPYLTGMAGYFNAQEEDIDVHVLRYVPVRRFTFQVSGLEAYPDPVVAKFKRKSRFQEGFDRLTLVSEGCKGEARPFTLPSPLGLDEHHRIYYQSVMQGKDLSLLLNETNHQVILKQVGRHHAALHRMKVEGLPVWDFEHLPEEIHQDIAWICFFFPKDEPFFKELSECLFAASLKISPHDFTFCHGDFVCSQLLKEGEQWAVIDFDLARLGDPLFEVAMLIASLRYDLPYFEGAVTASNGEVPRVLRAAEEAYLTGYQEQSGFSFNRKRFLWYRIRSEIYYLALMIKKDRFHPLAFQYGMNVLYQLKDALMEEVS